MALPATLNALRSSIATTRQFMAEAVADQGVQFLKLDHQEGYWKYGSDETEVEQDSQWAVNPLSITTGYGTYDGDGFAPQDGIMALMTEPAVVQANLPPSNFPWVKQAAFTMRCLNGEDEGVQVEHGAHSKTRLPEMTKLITKIFDRIAAGDEECVPVIELEVDSYVHKKYKKQYKPVFTVIKWMAIDALPQEEAAQEEPEPEPEVIEAPKTKTRRTRAAKVEEEEAEDAEVVEEEKPKRRTRAAKVEEVAEVEEVEEEPTTTKRRSRRSRNAA